MRQLGRCRLLFIPFKRALQCAGCCVRAATGLPVYDAITACNFFLEGFQDNERFGLQGWVEDWDGRQDPYEFGQHVKVSNRKHLVN